MERLDWTDFETVEMELIHLLFLHSQNKSIGPGTMSEDLFPSRYWLYLSQDALPENILDRQIDRFFRAAFVGCISRCVEDQRGSFRLEIDAKLELVQSLCSFTPYGIGSEWFYCDESLLLTARDISLRLVELDHNSSREELRRSPGGSDDLRWAYDFLIADFFLSRGSSK